MSKVYDELDWQENNFIFNDEHQRSANRLFNATTKKELELIDLYIDGKISKQDIPILFGQWYKAFTTYEYIRIINEGLDKTIS